MSQSNRQLLAGRVVLVTGASAGIGSVVARRFAESEAEVALTARNPQKLAAVADDLQRQFPNRVWARPADVTDRQQVESLMAAAVQRFGRLDILVNNAGTGLIAPFEQVQPADAQTLFATNFFGAFHCLQAALPHFVRQQRGHVVNVASLAGLHGIPNSAVYSASKAALIALTDALRVEWRDYGVFFTVICPGRVRLADTGFFGAAKKYGPVKLYDAPEVSTAYVADAVVDAVIKRRRLVVLPGHARLTHLFSRFAPQLLENMLYKKLPRTNLPSV